MFRRKYLGWWALCVNVCLDEEKLTSRGRLAFIIAISVALSSYHNQIMHAIKPYADNISDSKWAWIIPVLLLIIVSFPPLIGHEIIILLVGQYNLFQLVPYPV
jgi:hypothetical protein